MKLRFYSMPNILLVSITLLVLATLSSTFVQAAWKSPNIQWEKTYGPYLAYSVTKTADGGYAIAGQNASFKPSEPHSPSDWQNYTALMIKTDKEGNVIWEKSYEAYVGLGLFSNRANSVKQTKDTGYALCGGNWFLKLDSQGNVQWNKTFSNLELFDTVQASNGEYLLIGNTRPTDSASSIDSVLIKTDENGNTLWSKTFGSNLPYRNEVTTYSLIDTNDAGYGIAGSWRGSLWFVKTDSNGNLIFNQTYSSISNFGAIFSSISKTSDGGYALAGYDVDLRKDVAWTAWVVKTDAQGNAQWSFHFEQPVSELLRGAEFRSIAQSVDGGYIVVGYPGLVRLDSSGKLQWNVTTYNAYSVSPTEDGGFIVAGGRGNPTSADQRIWLAKFAPESANPPNESRFQTIWVGASATIVAVAIVGLLVYLKKYRRRS